MATVEVRSVVKRFGSVQVLHGIDATIEDRSFVVLAGPSGCGKFDPFENDRWTGTGNRGEIVIGGRVVNDVEPKSRGRRHGLPELCALSAYEGFRQHGLQPEAGSKIDSATNQAEGVERAAEILNIDRAISSGIHGSFREGSGSALPWGAPSSATRRFSCSTNRCRISTSQLQGCKAVAETRALHQRS